MKKLKALLLALASVLCVGVVSSCIEPLPLDGSVSDSVSSETPETSETPEASEDTETSETPEEEFGAGYETITIEKALELCGEEAGYVTEEEYYIIATIDTVTNSMYGAMVISDETGSISVYNTKSADNVNYENMTDKPVKGDKVLLSCVLQNHNGTKEVKQAYIIDFKKAVIDESDYVEMTVADARTAEEGALVKTTGVVAKITYASGKVPNGVMLIDETGSIYVFDSDLAGNVEEGNKVTLLATKAYWILEKEQSAAEKFGYKGCNQLTDATLLSNDGKTNKFSKEAIEENTIKNIVENPVTNDITTIVYKVNALVKKVPGAGFVNYDFCDIDGETGSYTYTQCNGGDFAWLDEFDGKICTVYLTALNAKSSASGCIYRFLPVEVKDEGYVFDKANTATFALDYYAVDQFEEVYTSDPELELVTTVSSELLGFEGVEISYKSNKTEVVYFETVEDKVIFHCGEAGKAFVTITAKYEGKEVNHSFYITVEEAVKYDYVTVAEAIAAATDTEVIVKGIVGPSVVNKDGFYLFGEDGTVIAVLVDSTTEFVGLEIGNEIILQGMRERYVKNDTSTIAGQTCIVNAKILVNNYGNHEYSTAKFITDKTLADIVALPVTEDHTTSVYVITATVKVVSQTYFSNIYLTSGGVEIRLYTKSADQYTSWLKDGQEVVVELAPCNWNDQSKAYVGCVLAIRNADGTKTYNTLNFDNY